MTGAKPPTSEEPEEREIIATLARSRGRPLTRQKVVLQRPDGSWFRYDEQTGAEVEVPGPAPC
jgi:hypothetical protein